MGVTTQFARVLVEARGLGVNYRRTLTLGRQEAIVDLGHLERLLRRNRLWPADLSREAFKARMGSTRYVEPFLEVLGARETLAMDISAFEGAKVIHDLNQKVPANLVQAFDCVIDGGLLEHVFNIPTAIQNCMEMTALGGHVILYTTANNFFGHGFYQFSPELFYRVFHPVNGFRVVKMLVQENFPWSDTFLGLRFGNEFSGPRYEVPDPVLVKGRVELINKRPTVLYVIAQRTEIVRIFAATPNQSDYEVRWGESTGPAAMEVGRPDSVSPTRAWYRTALKETTRGRIKKVVRWLRVPVVWYQRHRWARQFSFSNRKLYRRTD